MNKALQKFDSWVSETLGLGTSTYDASKTTYFSGIGKINDAELESLYIQNDLAHTIVARPVDDALRQGVDVELGDDDETLASDIIEYAEELNLSEEVRKARTWSRLFGGAALWLGNSTMDLDQERPFGAEVEFLRAIDKRDLTPIMWYSDPAHPKFGLPAVYNVNLIGIGTSVNDKQTIPTNFPIHESWLVVLRGETTTRRRLLEQQGWGDSVLLRVYEVLRNFGISWGSITRLIQDSSQGIYKIKQLMELLESDNDELLEARLRLIDRSKSNFRPIVLDADGEDYSRISTSMSEMSNLMDRLMIRLAAAAGMPVTVLFGRSPAGMNSTGESDFQAWYDLVKAEQEHELATVFEQALEAILQNPESPTLGIVPDGLKVVFPSLWQSSPQEEANLYMLTAQADKMYIDSSVYLPEEVAIARSKGATIGPIAVDIDSRQKLLDEDIESMLNPMEPTNFEIEGTDEQTANKENDGASDEEAPEPGTKKESSEE